MAQFLIERTLVTTGLRDMLRTHFTGAGTGGTDLVGEVGEAPRNLNKNSNGLLIDPYWILFPMPTALGFGDLAHPESNGRLPYQLTSVGRTDESAGIMADLIRRAILERDGSGSFVRAISAGASMSVIDRSQREIGFLTPEAGLWNVHDTFDLEVQAHG